MLSAEYETEQAQLEEIIAKITQDLEEYKEDTDNISNFLALAEKYTDFSVLTAPMINEFIEKIVVHGPDRSSGERVQQVDIYFKFIGNFNIPMPEPTPEELAKMEKERIRREKHRESAKLYREKKKAEKLAKEQKQADEKSA